MGGTYRSARLLVCGPPAAGRKKKKRKKKEKKKKRGEKEYLSPARGPHPCAVLARAPSRPAGGQRPCAVTARRSWALFLPRGEKDRGDYHTGTEMNSVHRYGPVSQTLVAGWEGEGRAMVK
ncbi:hypothetical protein GW17_00057947 [Ensete ventricosum]|nr:hypothetical protein GW17_00057947 [Ensete ventricosum]